MFHFSTNSGVDLQERPGPPRHRRRRRHGDVALACCRAPVRPPPARPWVPPPSGAAGSCSRHQRKRQTPSAPRASCPVQPGRHRRMKILNIIQKKKNISKGTFILKTTTE